MLITPGTLEKEAGSAGPHSAVEPTERRDCVVSSEKNVSAVCFIALRFLTILVAISPLLFSLLEFCLNVLFRLEG